MRLSCSTLWFWCYGWRFGLHMLNMLPNPTQSTLKEFVGLAGMPSRAHNHFVGAGLVG